MEGISQQMSRTDRTRAEIAAAVRAAAFQHGLGAGCAECALERADHRLARIGRQILVAALAVGAELEHGTTPQAEEPENPIPEAFRHATPSANGAANADRKLGLRSADMPSIPCRVQCCECLRSASGAGRPLTRPSDPPPLHQTSISSSAAAASPRGASAGTNCARSAASSFTAIAGFSLRY